jgi:hypothetical protein
VHGTVIMAKLRHCREGTIWISHLAREWLSPNEMEKSGNQLRVTFLFVGEIGNYRNLTPLNEKGQKRILSVTHRLLAL